MTQSDIDSIIQNAAQQNDIPTLIQYSAQSPLAVSVLAEYYHNNFIAYVAQIADFALKTANPSSFVYLSSALRYPRYGGTTFMELPAEVQNVIREALLTGLCSPEDLGRGNAASGIYNLFVQMKKTNKSIALVRQLFEWLLAFVQVKPEASLGFLLVVYLIFSDQQFLMASFKKYQPTIYHYCCLALAQPHVPIQISAAQCFTVILRASILKSPECEEMNISTLMQLFLSVVSCQDETLHRWVCSSISTLLVQGYPGLTIDYFSALFTAISPDLTGANGASFQGDAIHIWHKLARYEGDLIHDGNECENYSAQLADSISEFLFTIISNCQVDELISDSTGEHSTAKASFECLQQFGRVAPDVIFQKCMAFVGTAQAAMQEGVENATIAALTAVQVIAGLPSYDNEELGGYIQQAIANYLPTVIAFTQCPKQSLRISAFFLLNQFVSSQPDFMSNPPVFQELLNTIFAVVQRQDFDRSEFDAAMTVLLAIFNEPTYCENLVQCFQPIFSVLDQALGNPQCANVASNHIAIMLLAMPDTWHFETVFAEFIGRFQATMMQNMPPEARVLLCPVLQICAFRYRQPDMSMSMLQMAIQAVLVDQEPDEIQLIVYLIKNAGMLAVDQISQLLGMIFEIIQGQALAPTFAQAVNLIGCVFHVCPQPISPMFAQIMQRFLGLLEDEATPINVRASLLDSVAQIVKSAPPEALLECRDRIVNIIIGNGQSLPIYKSQDIESTLTVVSNLYMLLNNLAEKYYDEESPERKGQFSINAISTIKLWDEAILKNGIRNWNYNSLIKLIIGAMNHRHIMCHVNLYFNRYTIARFLNEARNSPDSKISQNAIAIIPKLKKA